MAFKDYLTAEGERLLAKSIIESTPIVFTKMVLGSGYLAEGTSEKNVSEVITPVKELALRSIGLVGTSTTVISAYFDNTGLDTGFYFREKAIYMQVGDEEVVGIYGNARSTAEYIDTADVCIIEKMIRTTLQLTTDEMAHVVLSNDTSAVAPIIKDGVTLDEFVTTSAALAVEAGQMLILDKSVYYYIGGDQQDKESYIPSVKLSDVYDKELDGADESGNIAASQNALNHAYRELAAKLVTVNESLGKKMSITIVDDDTALDNLTSPGTYFCAKWSNSNNPCGYGVLTVDGCKHNLRQIMTGLTSSERNRTYIRVSSNGGTTWTEWEKVALNSDLANYLPLTGGSLTGNLGINTGTNIAQVSLGGAGHKGAVSISGDVFGLFDLTRSKWIITSDGSGAVTVDGVDIQALSKTSSKFMFDNTSKMLFKVYDAGYAYAYWFSENGDTYSIRFSGSDLQFTQNNSEGEQVAYWVGDISDIAKLRAEVNTLNSGLEAGLVHTTGYKKYIEIASADATNHQDLMFKSVKKAIESGLINGKESRFYVMWVGHNHYFVNCTSFGSGAYVAIEMICGGNGAKYAGTYMASSDTIISYKDFVDETDLGNYLPKKGGRAEEILYVGSTGATTAETLAIQNNKRNILNQVTADGKYVLYDGTNGKDIIKSTLDGTVLVDGVELGKTHKLFDGNYKFITVDNSDKAFTPENVQDSLTSILDNYGNGYRFVHMIFANSVYVDYVGSATNRLHAVFDEMAYSVYQPRRFKIEGGNWSVSTIPRSSDFVVEGDTLILNFL